MTLLREWAASGQLTMPVIMMSGHGTIETAVEATKIGAFDFLEKPVGLQKLLGTVARALKIALAQGAAARFAREHRHERRDARRRAADGAAARGEEAGADPGRARRGTRRGGARAARRRYAARGAAERRAARVESARRPRRGSRRHALLRRDRPVREGRAARARVPAAEARQGECHARVHEHGAARQHGRREQVRRGVAGGAVRPAPCCSRRCAPGARTSRR